jgi:membrane-associated PAP2 superfamily phosphatase
MQASLRYSKGTKQWIGGKRIITLTGWTHLLHTNAKRKCVSILASIAELHKTIDMRRRAGRGGTHVAILLAVGVVIMVSFSFVARSTLAITAPSERLCDKNK